MLRNIFSLEYIDDKCWVCILDEVVVSEEIDKIVYGTWWFLVWFFIGLFIGSFMWILPFLISIFLLPLKLPSYYYFYFFSLFNALIIFLILHLARVSILRTIAVSIGSAISSGLVPYMIYMTILDLIANP